MTPRFTQFLIAALLAAQIATIAALVWLLSRQPTTQISFPIPLVKKEARS